jgi:hypothetical protein
MKYGETPWAMGLVSHLRAAAASEKNSLGMAMALLAKSLGGKARKNNHW